MFVVRPQLLLAHAAGVLMLCFAVIERHTRDGVCHSQSGLEYHVNVRASTAQVTHAAVDPTCSSAYVPIFV